MQIFRHNGIAGNQLAQDYINKSESVLSLFPYQYGSPQSLRKRWESLMNRSFPRTELTEAIHSYMKPYGITTSVKQSLEKLSDQESTVIIGGQQAGLLGGPLYTIHKIFALLKQAASAENELEKPVVPVFWIAGEDHDYEEVNHVFVRNKNRWDKKVYPERTLKKKMISEIPLNQTVCQSWVKEVLKAYGETPYTGTLLTTLESCIRKASTLTDFFTAFIHELFKDYGLLLIDACHPTLRKLEQPLFFKIVEEGPYLIEDIQKDQEEIEKLGYKAALQLDPETIHLFVTIHGDRELLFYDKENRLYYTKSGRMKWSKEDLLATIESNPQYFSNNVATRPLSQEYLFPSLGFIGGPGEIAYWAELRNVFNRFQLEMAPVIPRLQVTYLEHPIQKKLHQYQLQYEEVVTAGIEPMKKAFLDERSPTHLFNAVETTIEDIRNKYDDLLKIFSEYDRGLLPVIHKNEKFVIDQLHFLEEHTWNHLEKKNEKALQDLDYLEAALYPFGGLQERIWNVCYFINQYGFEWVHQILAQELESGGNHYVISI